MSLHDLKKSFLVLKDSIRHFISRSMYDFKSSEEPFSPTGLKKAVIYRADGKLGDAVCFLPFIRELRRFSPDCEITVLSNSNTAQIYEAADFIDKVIIFPKKPKNHETDKYAAELHGCDLYIHLFEKLKGRHLRLINRIHPKWIATLDKSLKCDNLGIYEYTSSVDERGLTWEQSEKCLHITDLLFRILEKGGIAPDDIDRSYFRMFADDIPAAGPRFAFLKSPENRPGEKTVIFNPYGASSSRRFTDGCIINVITELLEKTDMHVVLWTGPADRERGERLLADNFGNNGRVSVTGVLSSAREIITAMASCDAMIGVDTGSAHVAACFDIPELTFYGNNPANYSRWYAKAPKAVNVILKTANFAEAESSELTEAVRNFIGDPAESSRP